MTSAPRILVVRLGSMGDVIATLPAVASLKHSIPHSRITWVVDPKWDPLLEDNPYVDSLVHLDRRVLASLRKAWRELRTERFDLAVDFQGLVKSALVATVARAERIFGFEAKYARESAASWFYSTKVPIRSYHAVERNLDLAAAAGASNILRTFPLPPGVQEAVLPEGDFVLASPLAGWGAKQWPLEFYSQLAARLRRDCGLPLVIDAPYAIPVEGAQTHVSSLRGLVYATRKAIAVVGVDSGPLHLAAALGKPGVAVYGPTEPARHGPYGGTITVLRSPRAATTYRRTSAPDTSMREITPDQVFAALEPILAAATKHH
ncbi:MAG TPA: glycosyltransferase family 9 protein [Bryobacteraceae bacterium]|nr:glycosyltransferase family 9 protein [Bryobacteraceae bacterium]